MGFPNSLSVRSEDAAGQTVGRGTVDGGQDLGPLFFGVDVQRHNRTEQLFTHRPIVGLSSLNQSWTDKESCRIIGLPARDDLSIVGLPSLFEITGKFLE